MKVSFKLTLLIILAVGLAACTQTVPLKPPVTIDTRFDGYLNAAKAVSSYRAQISVKAKNVVKSYILDSQSPDLIETKTHQIKGVQTFIYQAQNIFVNNPGDKIWYKLTIAKKDPARDYGDLNFGDWLNHPSQMVYQKNLSCGADACSEYQYTDSTGLIHLVDFSAKNGLPVSHLIQNSGQEITVNFTYPVITITPPVQFTDYHFPASPTSKDLQLLQAIYNL